MNDLFENVEKDRKASLRIQIKIPQKYHDEPIINNLGSLFELKVNIFSAILGANAQGDGWFDLLISGSLLSIEQALLYLCELDVEIWNQSKLLPDGW